MAISGLSNIPQRERKQIESSIRALGLQLQERRNSLGYTQEQFAEKLDISVNTIKFIEQGRRTPSLPMLLRLAKYLKLDVKLISKQFADYG